MNNKEKELIDYVMKIKQLDLLLSFHGLEPEIDSKIDDILNQLKLFKKEIRRERKIMGTV